jgi:hypothetical protein
LDIYECLEIHDETRSRERPKGIKSEIKKYLFELDERGEREGVRKGTIEVVEEPSKIE